MRITDVPQGRGVAIQGGERKRGKEGEKKGKRGSEREFVRATEFRIIVSEGAPRDSRAHQETEQNAIQGR